jgi:outer membrane protein OmpA-like peptidoglycan-associated protein
MDRRICGKLLFEERGNKMLQKEMNKENTEIEDKAFELYTKHGSKDGSDSADWLEAERQIGEESKSKRRQIGEQSRLEHRQIGEQSRSKRDKQTKGILYVIVGLLCAIVVILLLTLFKETPRAELSELSLSKMKIMMLVMDPVANEKVVVFGDTHFDFGESALSQEAKTLLDKDVQVLKENPQTDVRMAGYTSAKGSEEVNQALSEKRANAVRDYLIEEGIAPERITVIGYGRTRPALYEVTPGDINSKEAMANMRVLFEVVVK